jgi:hypothetical protein
MTDTMTINIEWYLTEDVNDSLFSESDDADDSFFSESEEDLVEKSGLLIFEGGQCTNPFCNTFLVRSSIIKSENGDLNCPCCRLVLNPIINPPLEIPRSLSNILIEYPKFYTIGLSFSKYFTRNPLNGIWEPITEKSAELATTWFDADLDFFRNPTETVTKKTVKTVKTVKINKSNNKEKTLTPEQEEKKQKGMEDSRVNKEARDMFKKVNKGGESWIKTV